MLFCGRNLLYMKSLTLKHSVKNTMNIFKGFVFLKPSLLPPGATKRSTFIKHPTTGRLTCIKGGTKEVAGKINSIKNILNLLQCTVASKHFPNKLYDALKVNFPGVVWSAKNLITFLIRSLFWESILLVYEKTTFPGSDSGHDITCTDAKSARRQKNVNLIWTNLGYTDFCHSQLKLIEAKRNTPMSIYI